MIKLAIIHAWLASIVLTLFPAARKFPNDEMAQQQYIDRVNLIVEDIAKIEYDENHNPWFSGKWARAKEASLVTIIASEESGGFEIAVENGTKRGDRGASWCFMAINIGKGKTSEGWFGTDLIQDRSKCFSAGINIMQRSMNQCRGYGFLSGLSAYNTGRCIQNESISVSRLSKVLRFVNKTVPEDVEILEEIAKANQQQGQEEPPKVVAQN